MSEFKFTKGKWSANKLSILNENSRVITQCYLMTFEHDKRGRQIPDTIGYYNALLISKAPEMLEMLQEIITDWEFGNEDNFIMANNIDKAKKIIKEATEL
jgi:predicted Zn-dependent peptidase